jgi:hypothetical protein
MGNSRYGFRACAKVNFSLSGVEGWQGQLSSWLLLSISFFFPEEYAVRALRRAGDGEIGERRRVPL